MEIALLVPYCTGSHANWAGGLARFSRHTLRILSLSGFFWKWRMHGGAVMLAREFLAEARRQYGYVESLADYARLLWRADILPVTSQHDSFGASVVEAIYCGVYPLLPRR